MDFDNFKRTNDEKGHRVGDLVLIEIAHRLCSTIRMTDLAVRFGGDEFVVLAVGLENIEDVAHFAQKIVKSFNTPIVAEKKIVKTSVSIGIALYPNDGLKPGELLRLADMALYESKKSGGNQYKFYSKLMLKKQKRVMAKLS